MLGKYTFELPQFNVKKDGIENTEFSVWNTWVLVYMVVTNIYKINSSFYT